MASDRELEIEFSLNGEPRRISVLPEELLLDVLREKLRLTGAKRSCDVEVCGSCTVLLSRKAVSACTTLAVEADGQSVDTVEGLAVDGRLCPLQEAFIAEGAMQCGFCTPGFLMSASALLDEKPHAGEHDIASYLNGNICRCGGYNNILAAVSRATMASD